ncbi:NADase-type glycan-binding domain-containing protein [Paucidesulfovibrio longus]|uniref:NADase-type glycan-binding domain-containing protein n=1 Tax=Paucidesulfovibrio longus TaxID=889 RepID=UPI0003B595FE|nr:hypothetical protein [Paucidesulfovibrio longus]
MKRFATPVLIQALTLALLLLAAPAQAIEFTVSASSEFMPLFGSFGPENLLDGDPATAWAEGVEGPGEGEWVLFEFGRELLVERMGVRNGWQSEGSFETNNRPASVRLVFSDGTEQRVSLDESADWQMVEVDKRTASVRMVIDAVRKGTSELTYNRTCVSDVSFELALPPGAAGLAAGPAPEGDAPSPSGTAPAGEISPETSGTAEVPATPRKKVGLADLFAGEKMPVLPGVDVDAMGSASRPAAPAASARQESPASAAPKAETPTADAATAEAPTPGPEAKTGEATPEPKATKKHRFSIGDLFGSLDRPVLPPVDMRAMSGGDRAPSEAEPPAPAPSASPQQAADAAPTDAAAAEDEAHREALDELPRVDVEVMAGERKDKGGQVAGIKDQEALREAIRAYFTKLVTLDDGYTELYAEHVREEEAFMFEYFKELQRQRHVFHLFRNALVDTAGLRFGPALSERDRIKLEVDGSYTIYVGETYEDMSVHTIFTFVSEHGKWRILAAEDLEAPAGN